MLYLMVIHASSLQRPNYFLIRQGSHDGLWSETLLGKLKGTVLWDWDGLYVVWMDRSPLSGDELLVDFLNYWYMYSRYWNWWSFSPKVSQKGFPYAFWGNGLSNISEFWQPNGKFVRECQIVTTLWHIYQKVLATLCEEHIFVRRVENTLWSFCYWLSSGRE
jgi:hypothetical protein